MVLQVAGDESVVVQQGAFAFAEGVGTTGIHHEVEGLALGDEAVDEGFRAGEVGVVVSGAVDDKEIAGEAIGEVDG